VEQVLVCSRIIGSYHEANRIFGFISFGVPHPGTSHQKNKVLLMRWNHIFTKQTDGSNKAVTLNSVQESIRTRGEESSRLSMVKIFS
jgi:hypothetical protein